MTKFCIFLCVCLVYIFSSVAAQQCSTAALNQLIQCEEAAKTAAMADEKNSKTAEENCFTTNQCNPKVHRGHHESAENAANEATRNQTRQCFEAVFQNVHATVATCVQTATGLTLPTDSEGGHHGGRRGPKGRGKHGKGGEEGREGKDHKFGGFEAKLRRACENSTIANAGNLTLQCLNATRIAGKGNLQTFCAARNVCTQAFTQAGCNITDKFNARKQVMNASRTCMEQNQTPFATLAANVPQCAGLNLTAIADHHKGHGGKGGEEEHGPREGGPEGRGRPEGEKGKGREGRPEGKEEHGPHGRGGEHDPADEMCKIFTGEHEWKAEGGRRH